jgi:hypothetical protein
MKNDLAVFEEYKIRRLYDEKTETWFFSVVDIIQALTQQPDYQAARNYWKVLKNRLNKEGSESVTKCNRLKLEAADGPVYRHRPAVLPVTSCPSRQSRPDLDCFSFIYSDVRQRPAARRRLILSWPSYARCLFIPCPLPVFLSMHEKTWKINVA